MVEETRTAETSAEDFAQVDSHADVDMANATNDAINEAEFEGDAEGGKKAEGEAVSAPKSQTKEQNAENARRRREAERQQELKKAREETIIETLDGRNPYTGEEMKDSEDVAEYLTMKRIEKEGGDPLSDFSKYAKKQNREAAEAAKTASGNIIAANISFFMIS